MLVNAAVADEMDALDMSLAFTQILSIEQSFEVPWHPHVGALSSAMTVVNFDV